MKNMGYLPRLTSLHRHGRRILCLIAVPTYLLLVHFTLGHKSDQNIEDDAVNAPIRTHSSVQNSSRVRGIHQRYHRSHIQPLTIGYEEAKLTDTSTTDLVLGRIPPMIIDAGSPHQTINETTNERRDNTDEGKGDDSKTNEVKDKSAETNKGSLGSSERYVPCEGQTNLPNGGFCLDQYHLLINDNKIWDGKLCRGLEDLFGRSTVLDLGAGLGHYGRCFYRFRDNVIDAREPNEMEYLWQNYWHEMGIGGLQGKKRVIRSWTGYDGARNIAWLSDGFIKELDLTQPIQLNRKYDWVMSLEVGEQLPKYSEGVFLDNVSKFACKGIVISWSTDSSDKHGHVNPQSNTYIIEHLEERGFIHDQKSQDVLRDTLRLEHFKKSVLVFRVPKHKEC